MNTRLSYRGGDATGRLNSDKLASLKKALLYSYQAETIVLEDGREFKGLINPDKKKPDYDNKILSIPYQNNCLNEKDIDTTKFDNIEEIGMKPGSVFQWKENGTYWIVYLQHPEERAYFRAEIRQCDESAEIEIKGKLYKIYLRGPVETKIQWRQQKGTDWNDLNYSLVIYITKNEDTLDYFKRFAIVPINGDNWEVQAVNKYRGDGIIEVVLKETFNNTIKDEQKIEEQNKPTPPIETESIYIAGDESVYPYETYDYLIQNTNENGKWMIDNSKKVQIISQNSKEITLSIISGKSGRFNLIYQRENNENIIKEIKINSL